MNAPSRPHRVPRGFTLIELMVAMAAGLIVGVAAMILARSSTKVFQEEARITATQLAASLGMSRLTADLQRAGFLTSANPLKDPETCTDFVGWTDGGMNTMAAIRIIKNGSYDANPGGLKQSNDNGFQPDSIVIGGSFSNTEQFPVRTIVAVGGGFQVFLQDASGAMARARVAASNGGEPICGANSATGIFRPGRFLRVVDAEGRVGYGVITACTDNGSSAVVQLASSPALIERTPATTCGYRGHATGLLANPVSRVRYDIQSLKGHARFGTLVAPPADATQALVSGDGTASPAAPGRTELVRVELDNTGAPIADTLELVAEYAVDLEFGVSAMNAAGTTNPTFTRYPIPMTDAGYLIADTPLTTNAFPERVRAVQVRLSTRSRTPDRDGPLSAVGPVGQLGRFQLLDVPSQGYARMRRMHAEVALPNLNGATF